MKKEMVSRIASWLIEAERPVIFTGAGMSTESGIPDFRSPGGIWTKYRTVYYDEFLACAYARHINGRHKNFTIEFRVTSGGK